MRGFRPINDPSEITLQNCWKDAAKFINKNKIIEKEGVIYQVIAKKERAFSLFERIARGALGVLIVCGTLGCALFYKPVYNLFAKKKDVIHFGLKISKDA